ncbi:hypothetical protein H072_4050 [Dactylellina haptotyla CBS 200.50]|uniref:C3H1-type domain-containing protein n=1 Tax=Dactylellina haptotyla (strain CBS 200.50) TaxID=1284197 RepID=S8C2Z7_DACHA|nr:hypothetical protein H072_4050 [Dactylellina haptotyla CBS 200.50]
MADSSRAADEDFPVPLERPAGLSMAGSAAAGDEAGAAPSSSSSQTHVHSRGQARAPQTAQKAPRPCKFYATKTGCKKGSECPFSHGRGQTVASGGGDDRSAAQAPGTSSSQRNPAGDRPVRHTARGSSGTDALAKRRHLPAVDPSRVVRRPTPAGENTPEVRRENEINQLKRRWGPLFQEVDQEQGLYRLELKQSDDFPYDLDALRIEILVPLDYLKPGAQGPTVKVLNEDIPRGHQFNIERGFSSLVRSASKTTRLLDLVNNLDKRLEDFLSSEKAATFKIVPNLGAVAENVAKLDVNDHQLQQTTPLPPTPQPQVFQKPAPPKPVYTAAEKEAAGARRALETRQLEARLRQSNVFWKNAPGTIYKVPLEPRMKNLLPAALLLLKAVDLKVPQLYPLEPCAIGFDRSFPTSITASIERSFHKRAREKSEASLMAQLNYLAQNLHNMIEIEDDTKEEVDASAEATLAATVATAVPEAGPSTSNPVNSTSTVVPGKPHVIIVENTRPPEWDDDSTSESDSEEPSESDEDVEETGEANQVIQQEPVAPEPISTIERGTSISFPDIKLKNIELLELKTINITMKCTRCKTVADINNIKAKENRHSRPKLLGCLFIPEIRFLKISEDDGELPDFAIFFLKGYVTIYVKAALGI